MRNLQSLQHKQTKLVCVSCERPVEFDLMYFEPESENMPKTTTGHSCSRCGNRMIFEYALSKKEDGEFFLKLFKATNATGDFTPEFSNIIQ